MNNLTTAFILPFSSFQKKGGMNEKTLWLYSDMYDKILALEPTNNLDLSSMAVNRNKRYSAASKRIITNIMYRGWLSEFFLTQAEKIK